MKDNNIDWRPYQIECKKKIKQRYDNGINKQLIVQATGTGKRMQAVDLAKHFPRTLFIAHREELIMQAYEELDRFWAMQVGIIKGPVFEIDKRMVVASAQTLHNRLEKMDKKMFQLIIVDEGHHFVSPTFIKPLRYFEPKLTTIWTATPKRLDGLSLSNIAQEIVFQYQIQDGIKDGFLAKLDAYQINTPVDLSRIKKTAGDFNLKELSVKVDSVERNKLVASKLKEYSVGEQAVVYCVDMDHAYHLRDALREEGFHAETIVSDTERCPNRRELLDAFEKGEINVLTNVNILTEGWDYADVGFVVMARPTQSETLYIQCVGRGTRIKSEEYRRKFAHDRCTVLDFVDNTGKHSLVNAYTLEENVDVENRIFLPDKKKEELIQAKLLKIKREREMRVKFGTDKRINLLMLPEVKVWDSEKMLEPATEKQIKWLIDVGLYQDDVEYTKLQASELISNLPAADWQCRYLATNHYDISKGATIGQYQRVRKMIENKQKYAMEKKVLRSFDRFMDRHED